MKITLLEKSGVKYKGRYLTPLQTYHDIDETTAQELIDQGVAKQVDEKIASVSYETESKAPKTQSFDPKANGGYVAEAKLTEAQKKKLEEEGAAENDKGEKIEKDDTPVTGKDTTVKSNVEDQKVDKEEVEVHDESGKTLTAEEIAAKERAAAAGESDRLPTREEAQASGEVVE